MLQTKAVIPNLILAALPAKDYMKLGRGLTSVELAFGDVLYEPGEAMSHVYFPTACLVSLLTIAEGHLALEVGMVGREGIVGTALALGITESPVRALVQGGGPALRMTKARFLDALQTSPSLHAGVDSYIHALMGQITQTAACNRFHVVESRLARWLLMTRDRIGSAEFPMTHAFLSHMLGVRREGVTEAASAFQRQKLIQYTRGKMRILDHRGLEAASCACYACSTAGPGTISPWRPARRSFSREAQGVMRLAI